MKHEKFIDGYLVTVEPSIYTNRTGRTDIRIKHETDGGPGMKMDADTLPSRLWRLKVWTTSETTVASKERLWMRRLNLPAPSSSRR